MTIDQLITALTGLREEAGGDAPVIVDGDEDGCYQDICVVEAVTVMDLRNPDYEWASPLWEYYEKDEYDDGQPHDELTAVVIHR